MAPTIRSRQVDILAEELASRRHVTKAEAMQIALENELLRSESRLSLWSRLKPLRDRVAAAEATGLAADKAFFDTLSGEN